MKPAPFAYERPATLDDALRLLREHGDQARVLAGGQSLMPLLNMRKLRPRVVIDITRLPALDRVKDDGAVLSVGALVTQFELGERTGLDDCLRECLPYTGHYVTRHRGTIGGSIAYGEPRGELPLSLLVLGARAVARSQGGEREIAAEDLYVGPFRTSLAADELIVHTQWPRCESGEGRAFAELAQRHGDFTLASAACSVTVDGERIVEARVGVGAVADRPLLVPEAARSMLGRPAADVEAAAGAAGGAASAAITGYDDHFASAEYRRHLAGVMVADATRRALGRVRSQFENGSAPR